MIFGILIAVFASGAAYAGVTANDEVFANAALRELHKLAIASAQLERAGKESDDLGCTEAAEAIRVAAHQALESLHYMSFEPINAIRGVSNVLRLSPSASASDCRFEAGMNLRLLLAGQAIMLLRWDYAIGGGDWYRINPSGHVEAENPLRYAQSLKEQGYSWIDVRPKGVLVIAVPDWKSEMASHAVDDHAIANSGNNLQVVEVGYRKDPGDQNVAIRFYRTKEQAEVAAQANKRQEEIDVEWKKKFLSLPYMIANKDDSFKIIFTICRSEKGVNNENICKQESSYDWSDKFHTPYFWFSDFMKCDNAKIAILAKHPDILQRGYDKAVLADCVPAPPVNGRKLRGYQMTFSFVAPDADGSDSLYTSLRDRDSDTAATFKEFRACSDAIDAMYLRISNDSGVDENGVLLNDKTRGIQLMANCVKVY